MFDKVTLFYSKNTNKIKLYCTGEQSMDYFGEDKDDYNYDFITISDLDVPFGNIQFLLNNLSMFTVANGSLNFESEVITKQV